ncbi:DUF4238 domain-containing protein [Sphingobium sp.]|uniref:DUF4238 domain-containing protein n=1 Tax=Sphingobium sp. TaxID=1912891 RepID=UPI000DAF6F19|nr:DUF4238 domain-containing protein [Sphingobium sp.]PZU67217.1 MAG: hypothetical protein DI540_11545 [Sphingobium sp.]
MSKKGKIRDGAQNQHYVPKFILRNFLWDAKKELVNVIDKRSSNTFTPNIAGIMGERRFNEFVIDDHMIATFEPAVGKVENLVKPAYDKVISDRRLDNSEEQKALLAYLIAFQLLRTKSQRDQFTQMDDAIREKWSGIPEIAEELAEMDDPAVLKARHAEFMSEALGDFAAIIAEKDFLLMEAPADRSFYIADNPVAMFNNEPAHPFWGNIGLSVLGIQIYLPIAHDLTLCAWCPSVAGKHRAETGAMMEQYKSALIGKLMRGEIGPSEVKAANAMVDEASEPIRRVLEHIENGTPIMAKDSQMDFYNSLQMRSSVRHVICPRGDFALAKRFIADAPKHNGPKVRVG